MKHIPLGRPFRLINPKTRTSFYEKAHESKDIYHVKIMWKPRAPGSPTKRKNRTPKR